MFVGAGVGEGSGVSVGVGDGTGVFVGTFVWVGTTVGVSVEAPPGVDVETGVSVTSTPQATPSRPSRTIVIANTFIYKLTTANTQYQNSRVSYLTNLSWHLSCGVPVEKSVDIAFVTLFLPLAANQAIRRPVLESCHLAKQCYER